MREIKAVLFDLDGTIYYGSKLIDGAAEVVEAFRQKGIKVFFMTNNSTKSRRDIYDRLRNMGLRCDVGDIYTSSYAAALYSKRKGFKSVYIFGTKGLKDEFELMGIESSDKADVVVIGYDMDVNYQKLTDALQVALNAKAMIACNREKNYPGENAKRMPGCGAMVGALECSVGKNVDYVVGKPNPLLLDIICTEQKIDKSQIMVIGDTYESDIEMSNEYGCDSIYIGNEIHENNICVKSIKEILDMV